MENLMSLVAVGLLKVLIVEGLNCAGLVGLTEIHLRVCLVKNRSAKLWKTLSCEGSSEAFPVSNRKMACFLRS